MPGDVAVAAEVPSAVGRVWHPRGASLFAAADVRRVAGSFLAITTSAAGLLVAARRLAGGVTLGLSSGGMAATVVVMLTCLAASDWLLPRDDRPWPRKLALACLPRIGLWACLWGVSGGSLGRGTGAIALVGAAVALLPLRRRDWTQWLRQPRPLTRVQRPQQPTLPPGQTRDTTARLPTLATIPRDDESFLQQQIRRRTTAGGESIRGTVVVSFQTGERLAVAHVGFCPPFQESPTVHLSTAYDEMDAVVTPGEVLPWGIRVECRLEEAAEDPFDIPVDFVATAAVAQAN